MFKAGRNDPCPCGSGKKFKKCHGAGGPKKFVATVLSNDSKNLLSRINAVTNEISSSSAAISSLKNRVTSNADAQTLNKAIEEAKFHQQHALEQQDSQEKKENYNL